MHRFLLLSLLLLMATWGRSQDVLFEVHINAEQTGEANNPVYSTLEQALTEFLNQTPWTDRNLQAHQRIQGSLLINITSRQGNSFAGSMEIRSSRPVFGSNMQSPVFSFRDPLFSFDYTENENLQYSPQVFHSNLVSVISFYVYTILGLDADTFELEGGTPYYQIAGQIVSAAQSSTHPGWSSSDGRQSRYSLNADLLSNVYSGYRLALYTYHRNGLDLMHQSLTQGKQGVRDAILQLEAVNQTRPGALLTRIFFDAKAREVQEVFSAGPSIEMKGIYRALTRMAPTYSQMWRNIPQ